MTDLIGVGYWRSLYEPLLPDPAWFVDPHWPVAIRQIVVDYLAQGHPLTSCMGYSWCRFRFGTPGDQLGSADLTDGLYCWPAFLPEVIQHILLLAVNLVGHILY